MFKYIKKLIELYKEVNSAIAVLKNNSKVHICKDNVLNALECRKLNIKRGGYVSCLLAYYRDKK